MTQKFSTAWNRIVKSKSGGKEVARVNGTDETPIGILPTVGVRPNRSGVIHLSKSLNTCVSLSDQHIPFQDKRVERQVFRFLKEYQPDTIVLNGDLVDFYSVSSFLKDPKRVHSLQDEIDGATLYIKTIRSICPNATLHYNMGNHEERLKRYLLSNAKALEGLEALKFENLFKLSEFEVKYHLTGFKLNREFLVTHGTRISKHSGGTARMEFESNLCSGVSGHTHRVGRYDVVGGSKSYTWVEQGCLCDMNPEYINHKPNWQQGFALIDYGKHSFHIREQRILDRKLVVDGVSYA